MTARARAWPGPGLGLALTLGLALALGGCFEDPSPTTSAEAGACTEGELGCACDAQDSCAEGVCVEGTCVEAEAETGTDGDSGDGDGDSGDGDGDSGDGDGDSGDGDGDSGDGDGGDGDGDGDSGDGDGDGDLPPGQCNGPEDCEPTEYCDFPDDFCGDLGPGVCTPRPNLDRCGSSFEITGCDCQVYPDGCTAAAMGVDFKCIGECC